MPAKSTGTELESKISEMNNSNLHTLTYRYSSKLMSSRLYRSTIDVPVLFIQATRDQALPPAMSAGMEKYVPNLSRKSVEAGHWALWEAPDQINGILEEWLGSIDNSQPKL